MFPLNSTVDIEDMSDEARQLANSGVVILKCYQTMNGVKLKVSTRVNFDVALGLVKWYVAARSLGHIVNVNIADYVDRGDLFFTIA